MATKIYAIENLVRQELVEPTPRFWSSDELTNIIIAGIKDLWRGVVELQSEHFLTVDETNVTMAASTYTLTGVPSDVHKVYLIEPLDGTDSGNIGLAFEPLEYNHIDFRNARNVDAITPKNETIYYAIHSAGSPVGAPTVRVAPAVNTALSVRFTYIPTISSSLSTSSTVPIPGDADNALVAWTVAYARAKEREDRAPDPIWLGLYREHRDELLVSLATRQVQEPEFVEPLFEDETPS